MSTNQPLPLTRHTCAFCGKEFWARRNDAKTCSNACRQKMLRWRKRLPAEIQRISQKIHEVAVYLNYPDSRDSAILYLEGVKKLINCEFDQRKIGAKYVQEKIAEEYYTLTNKKGDTEI